MYIIFAYIKGDLTLNNKVWLVHTTELKLIETIVELVYPLDSYMDDLGYG